MNVQQIVIYLEDLIRDILKEKERPQYISHKIRVLIDKIEQAQKEEEEFNQIAIS